MWLREYIFNLLIQPVHLVLYLVLVSSTTDLLERNPLYAVIAIGFMLPAEKFIRKMFGFEKAGTVGTIGAATGGALIMSAVNSIGKKGKNAAHAAAGDKGIKTKTPPADKIKVEDAYGVGIDRSTNTNNSQAIGGNRSSRQTATARTRTLPNGTTITTNGTNANVLARNAEDKEALTKKQEELQEKLKDNNLTSTERATLEGQLAGVETRINNVDNGQANEFPEENGNTTFYPGPSVESMASQNTLGEEPDDTNIYYQPQEQEIAPSSYQEAQEPDYTPSEPTHNLGFEINPLPQTSVDNDELDMNFNAGAGFKGVISRVGDSIIENRGKIAKTIIKGVAGTAGAAAIGTVGLAAGIATGDPSNAAKFAAAGGMAGGSLGSGTVEKADRFRSKTLETFREGGYGGAENYAKIKAQKEFLKNRENRRYFKEQLGIKKDEDVDKCMKLAAKYNRFGVTDVNDIRKGIKLQNDFKVSDKEAIVAIKTSKFITKDILVDREQKRKDYENHYISRVGEERTKRLFMLLDDIHK